MKTITLICLLIGVFITRITTSVAESSIELTADNFAQIVYEKPSFVKFYSPYCGHCQRLAVRYASTFNHIFTTFASLDPS